MEIVGLEKVAVRKSYNIKKELPKKPLPPSLGPATNLQVFRVDKNRGSYINNDLYEIGMELIELEEEAKKGHNIKKELPKKPIPPPGTPFGVTLTPS